MTNNVFADVTMQHKGCGGKIVEDRTRTYEYDSNECGRPVLYPAYVCTRCEHEILGDAEIDLGEMDL